MTFVKCIMATAHYYFHNPTSNNLVSSENMFYRIKAAGEQLKIHYEEPAYSLAERNYFKIITFKAAATGAVFNIFR